LVFPFFVFGEGGFALSLKKQGGREVGWQKLVFGLQGHALADVGFIGFKFFQEKTRPRPAVECIGKEIR